MKIFDRLKFAVIDLLRMNAAAVTVRGTDHAHYDWRTQEGVYVPIDYETAYRNGSRFAILKVVNGAVIQEHAVDELRRAHASPLFAMPYMWPYPVQSIPAALQAQKYYEVMREFPGMTIALDAEETPYYPNPQGSDHEAVIREYWQLDPEQIFLLYSNYHYIMSNGFNTSFFAQFPLWLSRPGIYEPVVPSAWTRLGKTWTIWQDNWLLPPLPYGVTNGKESIDGDKFNGTEEELADFFGGQIVVPPPPTGGTMIVTANYKVNIRREHYATSADDGDFLQGQTAEVLELWETGTTKGADYEQWARIAAGWVAVWYRALGTNGKLCELTGSLPPAGSKPVISVRLEAEGYPPFAGTWSPLP